MIKDFGWPIIAHERDFQTLDEITRLEHNYRVIADVWQFSPPTQKILNEIPKFMIPQSFENNLLAEFPSQADASVHLLTINYQPL